MITMIYPLVFQFAGISRKPYLLPSFIQFPGYQVSRTYCQVSLASDKTIETDRNMGHATSTCVKVV